MRPVLARRGGRVLEAEEEIPKDVSTIFGGGSEEDCGARPERGIFVSIARALLLFRSMPVQAWSALLTERACSVLTPMRSPACRNRLQAEAERLGLVSYLVCDAGHTQLAPNTLTVLAVGPGPVSLVDRVTGDLKLMS